MSLTPTTPLSQAVIQNAALLRRLADTARPIATKAALAAELGRDPGNSHRALKALQAEGIVDGLALTDLGRRVLHGLDVAEGNVVPATPDDTGSPPLTPRWPIGQCRPNPANRSIDDNDPGLHDLAESIIGAGDILQPLILTPVDDDGIRMILAGERRWRAARILAEGDDMPAALADGLPFTERAATAAEALLITIVENSQRQDLTPWEDARLLLQLADETGWTGAELARRIGRSGPDNRGGAKDVQDKLKIAREATPQAIAAYELTGSWDALRNSVRTPKPADPDQTDIEAHPADTPAPHRERLDGTTTADGVTWPAAPTTVLRTPWDGEPSAKILLTVSSDDRWHACLSTQTRTSGHAEPYGVFSTDPTFTTSHDALRQAAHRIRRYLGDGIDARLRDWLESILNPDGDPLVVNGVRQPNATRANEARVTLGLIARPSNSGSSRAPTADPEADGTREHTPEPGGAHSCGEPSPRGRLILLELAHKTLFDQSPIDTGAEWTGDLGTTLPAFGCPVGSYWLDADWPDLAGYNFARISHRAGGGAPLCGLTRDGTAWLLNHLPAWHGDGTWNPDVVIGTAIEHALAALGQAMPQGVAYATPWIETEAAAPDTRAPHPDTAPDSPATDADAWGRDHNAIVADRALLTRVTDMVAGTTTPSVTHRRDLLAALGFEGPFGTDDGRIISAMPVDALQPTPLAVVDRAHDLPDDRAQALALIVAWALNRAFNPGVDQ